MTSLYEAAQDFHQDVSEIAERTRLEEEQISRCNECGEPIESGGALLSPIKNQRITIQCGNCGSIYDECANELTADEVQD